FHSIIDEYYTDFYESYRQALWIGMGAVAIRADQLGAVGGLTDRWINAEDTDLWLRLGAAAGFVHIKSPVVFAYRQTTCSAVSDFRRTYAGIQHLLDQEDRGAYPGGRRRRQQRQSIIASHVRAATVGCLDRGLIREGLSLYRQIFSWSLRS